MGCSAACGMEKKTNMILIAMVNLFQFLKITA